MSACAAPCPRSLEVGGVAVDMEDHSAGLVPNYGIWVSCGVVEKPNDLSYVLAVDFAYWEDKSPSATSMVGSTARL